MDLHPDPVQVAATAAAVFDRLGIPYAIIGGLAASVHGITRFTADADMVLGLAGEDSERCARLVQALADEGFRLTLEAVTQRLRRGPRFITAYLGLTRLDVMLKRPDGLWQASLEHRRRHSLGGQPLWFASPEDVAALKLVAGRPQDLQDVRNVLVTQGGALDRGRLRGLVARYAAATGRPELTDALEGQLSFVDGLPLAPDDA